MHVNPYNIAQRFIGMKEVAGSIDNPQIMAMLKLDNKWPDHDEVPWCSAFVNYVVWLLNLPRSRSLKARSWLSVGRAVGVGLAEVGYDIVILQRGSGVQPGPDVIDAPGHVGFYSGRDNGTVYLLGGNQNNTVSVSGYPQNRILGIRRLI